MIDKAQKRAMIARRIAQELNDGDYVNLGIGLPTEVANHLPKGINVTLQSENGIMGVGPGPSEEDINPNLINAGGGYISEIPGTSYFDTVTSFAIIRGGHLDMTVLGALQVDQEGSIANWMIPGKLIPGMGGAMDLLVGAKKVVAALEHIDKHDNSKILKECNLPLTAYKALSLIVTDMALMEVTPKGLILREIASWTTLDDVIKATEADLIIPEDIKTFE